MYNLKQTKRLLTIKNVIYLFIIYYNFIQSWCTNLAYR